jgi:hypothetical protein
LEPVDGPGRAWEAFGPRAPFQRADKPHRAAGAARNRAHSIYLPEAMCEGLRVAAFKERRKIHDIVLEGIELALRKRGLRKIAAEGERRRKP